MLVILDLFYFIETKMLKSKLKCTNDVYWIIVCKQFSWYDFTSDNTPPDSGIEIPMLQ